MKKLQLWVSTLALICLGTQAVLADDDTVAVRKALKVCADPNYQPFSSRDQSGYENRIASLIGEALQLPVEYTWFPQRMGFVRNTLRKENPDGDGYLCDLVMGVPNSFELAVPSQPYLHSTYALVVAKEGKLGQVESPTALPAMADSVQQVKVGITERSPGSVWLAKYGLYDWMSPYVAQSGDPEEFPGQPMLEDLLAGKLDAAIVWGPTAAYFVKQGQGKLSLLPMQSEPGVRLDFKISTAVRFGEDDWEAEVNRVLDAHAAQIQAIIQEYGIPVVARDDS
ncbi:MAG: quinoprotein dehydrogenase-associated putative ABC transporter substrate-binding protein [Thiolinea sp.]